MDSYRNVVAICDSDLLGKYFEEDKFQLNLKESFYGGDEKNEEEALEIIRNQKKEDSTFNIVGQKSIHTAIKSGIITTDMVKKIQGVPFSMVLL